MEKTWGSGATPAAAAAIQGFKIVLLDIKVRGESKENRAYSLLEPAVAFHTDDSSIFLSPQFFFVVHGVVKMGVGGGSPLVSSAKFILSQY